MTSNKPPLRLQPVLCWGPTPKRVCFKVGHVSWKLVVNKPIFWTQCRHEMYQTRISINNQNLVQQIFLIIFLIDILGIQIGFRQ